MKNAITKVENKQLFTREEFAEPKNMEELLKACETLVASKILPKEIDTKEKAAVVILTGRELGLKMMASTRGIYVVNQKPALSAQMMLALAHATGELEDYSFKETGKGEQASCEMTVTRRGRAAYTCSFSVDDAKKLKKYENEWLKQPETMCRSRAISKNLRVTFPDAILGMYTPEEIQTIEVDDPKPAKDDMPKSRSGKVEAEQLPPPVEEVKNDPPKEEHKDEITRPVPAGFQIMKARFKGTCKSKECGKGFEAGSDIAFSKEKGSFHPDCAA